MGKGGPRTQVDLRLALEREKWIRHVPVQECMAAHVHEKEKEEREKKSQME